MRQSFLISIHFYENENRILHTPSPLNKSRRQQRVNWKTHIPKNILSVTFKQINVTIVSIQWIQSGNGYQKTSDNVRQRLCKRQLLIHKWMYATL